MGVYTAARKNVTKNVRTPNNRRRWMVPHVGIDLPSAPESCGPAGCAFERCGRTLHTAPVSTMNCCLLSSSCKKIMPPPRVFSSRQPTRFPGPTGNQACTFSPVHRRWCGSSRCRCRLCKARGFSTDGKRRRRSCGELSRRRPLEKAWIVELWFVTVATVLPLLLAYSLSAYSAILLQSLKS
jgi:hypothetical protein